MNPVADEQSKSVTPKQAGFDVPAEPFDVDEPTLRKWQELANTLAEIAGVPAGLIMRVSWPEIEVFVSSHTEGISYNPGDSEHLPGSGLYCETVIKSKDKLIVPDATSDPEWDQNPDIKLNMISYLGFPILLPNGQVFGTICVLDDNPNSYSSAIEKLMRQLRELVESHLSLIWRNHELQEKVREIEELRGILPICSYCKNVRNDAGYWEAVDTYFRNRKGYGFTHSICPECMDKHFGEMED